MTIDKAVSLAIGMLALVVAAPVALAQQVQPPAATAQAGSKSGFAACKADIQTLCKDAPSGLFGRIQCLKSNQDKLSSECMGAIATILGIVQTKAAAVENAPRPLQACQQDLAAVCPDLKAGDAGRMRCLRDNSAKLSPGCSAALKTVRTQSQAALLACNADRTRLCAAAGNKPADQLKCLKERLGELGAECRKLVDIVRPSKKAASKDAAAGVPGAVPPAKAASPQVAPPHLAAPPGSAPPPPAAITPRG